MKPSARSVRFVFLAGLLATLPVWVQGQAGQPAAQAKAASVATTIAAPRPAEKLKVEGLPNLGRVNERLYRGGQPKTEGYAELKKLGVEIVVNFRNEKDDIARERREVEAQGMRYVSVPWSGWDDPNNQQVAEFLELLRANPQKKIFAHCRHGAERTGVMVAAFRMAVENWTPEQALAEMEAFGFRGLLFHHLKKYVRAFPEKLKTDPTLRAFRPALH